MHWRKAQDRKNFWWMVIVLSSGNRLYHKQCCIHVLVTGGVWDSLRGTGKSTNSVLTIGKTTDSSCSNHKFVNITSLRKDPSAFLLLSGWMSNVLAQSKHMMSFMIWFSLLFWYISLYFCNGSMRSPLLVVPAFSVSFCSAFSCHALICVFPSSFQVVESGLTNYQKLPCFFLASPTLRSFSCTVCVLPKCSLELIVDLGHSWT